MPKLVYLDQNAWIPLAKSYYGLNKDEKIKRVCDAVIKVSEAGSHIFPISIVHKNETLTNLDHTQAQRLAEFMINVSKGYCIAPYTSILNTEIKYAVVGLCSGIKFSVPREKIVGIGIPYMLGSQVEITKSHPEAPKISEEMKNKLIDIVHSPDTLLWAFKNEEIAKHSRQLRQEIENPMVGKLEEIRRNDAKIKDKDLRRRVCVVKFFNSTIVPEMTKIILQLRIQDVFRICFSGIKNPEDMENFFQCMPTAYTLFSLTRSRDAQLDRKIEKNDLNDISFLTMAIPHCDVVVTEKMWTAIAKQNKLDKVYGTEILQSVEDLLDFL